VVERSIRELEYHADVLDALGLDNTAKIQIHVGGLYNDRSNSIERFIKNYKKLPAKVKSRLVIENDDRLYPLSDCLRIQGETGIPVLFDVFHHSILNNGEPVKEAISSAMTTWQEEDGILMTDYSSQEPDSKPGKHAETIDLQDFNTYIYETNGIDFDIMLEIKDKEISAVKAAGMVSGDFRFMKPAN
jgi:UV DNA damage endonuclease